MASRTVTVDFNANTQALADSLKAVIAGFGDITKAQEETNRAILDAQNKQVAAVKAALDAKLISEADYHRQVAQLQSASLRQYAQSQADASAQISLLRQQQATELRQQLSEGVISQQQYSAQIIQIETATLQARLAAAKNYQAALETSGSATQSQIQAVQMEVLRLQEAVAVANDRVKASVQSTGEEIEQGSQRSAIAIGAISLAYGAVRQAISDLSAIAMRFYQQFLGQNVALQELILGTATSIASTNKALVQGELQAAGKETIEQLRGPVAEAIDYIRVKSLDLVGVTSKEVIPLLQITSQHLGKLGGSITNAADLSVKFAAALGTLGIPLFQARQEVNSILQGQIDQNSMLAKTLGLTNEQVRNWTQQGILLEKLNERLGVFQEGNALAAKTLGGVTSNIVELFDEITRRVGAPVLEPIVRIFTTLYDLIRNNMKSLSALADTVGETIAKGISMIANIMEVGIPIIADVSAATMEVIRVLGTPLVNALVLVRDNIRAIGVALTGVALAFGAIKLQALLSTLPSIGAMLGMLQGQLTMMIGKIVALEATGSVAFTTLTAKVTAFGAALNASLGPIGWVTLALTGLVAGMLAYNESLVKAKEAAADPKLFKDFRAVIGDINQGIPVATERFAALKEELIQQKGSGKITNDEYERMARVLKEAEVRSEALRVELESLNRTQEIITQSALAYKKAMEEINQDRKLQEAEQEKALTNQLINEREYKAARIQLEVETNAALLAAKQKHIDEMLARERELRERGEAEDEELTLAIKKALAERADLEIKYYKSKRDLREEDSRREIQKIKEITEEWKNYSDKATSYIKRISDVYGMQIERMSRAKTFQDAQLDYLSKQVGYWSILMDARAADRKEEIDSLKELQTKRLQENEERIKALKEQGGSLQEIAQLERENDKIRNDSNRKIQELERQNLQELQIRQAVERKAQQERQAAARAALEVEEQIAIVKQKQLVLENQRAIVQAKLDQLKTQSEINQALAAPAEKRDPFQIKMLHEQLKLQQESMQILEHQGKSYQEQFDSIGKLFDLKKRTLELEQAAETKTTEIQQQRALKDAARAVVDLNPVQRRGSPVISSRPGARYYPDGPTPQQRQQDINAVIAESAKKTDSMAKHFASQVASASSLHDELEKVLKTLTAIDQINQSEVLKNNMLGAGTGGSQTATASTQGSQAATAATTPTPTGSQPGQPTTQGVPVVELNDTIANAASKILTGIETQTSEFMGAIERQTEALLTGLGGKLAPLESLVSSSQESLKVLQQIGLAAREMLTRPAPTSSGNILDQLAKAYSSR